MQLEKGNPTQELPRDSSSQRKLRLGTLVRLLVTVGLVVLLLLLVDIRDAVGLLLSADLPLLLAAVVVGLLDRALMIAKWYPLLRVQVPSIPFGRAARAYLASGFASLVLPATVGADALRALGLGRERRVVVEVGASIFAERLLGLVASGITALIALAVAVRSSIRLEFLVPWALASVLLAAAAVVLPLFGRVSTRFSRWMRAHPRTKLVGYLQRFGSAYVAYRGHARTQVAVGLLSLIEQGFPILAFWLLARALDAPVGFWMLVVAVPLALFVSRLPIAFGGVGPTEGAMVYLLSLFDVSPTEALAVALGGRLVALVAILPGVFFWAELLGSRRKDAIEVAEAVAPFSENDGSA